jgi:hypothetical protein
MPAEQTSDTREDASIYDWVSDTARDNPALVVGGAVAVGALAAMVLINRRPQSRARAIEKRLGRELHAMEKALRSRRPISTMSDHLADASGALASNLRSWDMDALRGLFSRASDLSSQFARERGWR